MTEKDIYRKKILSLVIVLIITSIIFLFLYVLKIHGGNFLISKLNIASSEFVVKEESNQMKKISENYYDYSLENLKMASEKGKTVLFFATNWCSTCTELDKELMKESERLGEGITVLRIDFDKDTELKKKYKVLVQHTLIQVDSKGNEIAKWIGGDINTINESVR